MSKLHLECETATCSMRFRRIACSLCILMAAAAQDCKDGDVCAGLTPGQISGVLKAEDGIEYMVFLPSSWEKDGADKKHPLLLFLHGRGGVKNPDNIRGQSLTRMLIEKAEFAASFPFVVITPVCPSAKGWPNENESLARLVESSLAAFRGDPARTYLAGQSMGGHGAWMLGAQRPDLFAAVVPVCGYLDRAKAAEDGDKALGPNTAAMVASLAAGARELLKHWNRSRGGNLARPS